MRPIPVVNMLGASETRDDLLKALIRQAQRYHFASLQDMNLVVAARHNAYATGIIGVVGEQSTEDEVKAIAGLSLTELRDAIYAMQDKLEGIAFEFLAKQQQ